MTGLSDQERWREELALKSREIDLREREIELAAGRQRAERWRNPLTVAVVAAALAGFFNAYVAYANNNAQLELETAKAESARILEVLKIGDPARVRENLTFLVQVGLIESAGLRRGISSLSRERPPVYLSPAAVAAFQREAGMPADGLAGPATRARMREAEQERARAKAAAGRSGY